VTARQLARLEATVRGVVQGVGFRWHVHRVASGLGLSGWVANAADGSVRVVAEGERAALESLLAAIRKGPAAASVRDVEHRWLPAAGGMTSFGVRAGAHPGD
jgi:acylphosphatase